MIYKPVAEDLSPQALICGTAHLVCSVHRINSICAILGFDQVFHTSPCSYTCAMMDDIEMNAPDEPLPAPPAPPSDPIERPPSPPPPPPEDSGAPPPPPDVAAPPPPPDDRPPAPPIETTKKKQGWGSKRPAAAPLSVEDLIRKKKEAEAAAAKVLYYLISKLSRLSLSDLCLTRFIHSSRNSYPKRSARNWH